MKKPKLLIIVLFQNLLDEEPYYPMMPAPPLPGLLLAGLTPDIVDIEVLHEMIRPIDYNTDADFIALSFMDYLAPHAYDVSVRLRAKGKIVVAGGKYCTNYPEEAGPFFDSILVGEAPGVWEKMVNDMVAETLKPVYFADESASLAGIPPPRYDLAEKEFLTPIVIETSRGCQHSCTYCQLNINKTAYRTRPVEDVINDLKSTQKLPWHKRTMAMIYDNNFCGNLDNAKTLLREIAKLKFWAIGIQFSIESLRDDEFVELLSSANCRMAFIGMESLNDGSLQSLNKKQNRVEEYKVLFDKLHRRGILTFTGLMFALDGDTSEYYMSLPHKLDDVGVSVILPSITIPIFGTLLYFEKLQNNKITDFDISHYEGDHIVFSHDTLSNQEIYEGYEFVNREFFSLKSLVKRWLKFMKKQSVRESLSQFILKIIIISVVYFKLSIFQRNHAISRVFNKKRQDVTRSEKILVKAINN